MFVKLTARFCDFALFMACPAFVSAAEELPQGAQTVAQGFLEMLDQNLLKQSFNKTAKIVQDNDNATLWYGALSSETGPVGTAEGREFLRTETLEKFGDLPKDKFLVAVYHTKFTKQAEAEEHVILHQNPDGSWGVAGYHIEYNKWPEAIRIIIRGIVIVFVIMCLLSFVTWAVGRVMQSIAKKEKAAAK